MIYFYSDTCDFSIRQRIYVKNFRSMVIILFIILQIILLEYLFLCVLWRENESIVTKRELNRFMQEKKCRQNKRTQFRSFLSLRIQTGLSFILDLLLIGLTERTLREQTQRDLKQQQQVRKVIRREIYQINLRIISSKYFCIIL